MSEKRQYKRWILLDKGSLQIKDSIEHPGHGWADLNALLERKAELEAENEWLQEQNKGLLTENQRMHSKLSSIAAERKNRNFWAKY